MAGKKGKQVTPKAQTPQPRGGNKAQSKRQTPKSAPPAKRKKLVEELDEEISDAEFEEMMSSVKAGAQLKKTGKHDSEESDEGENEDLTDDEDDDEDLEDDESSDEDDDEVELNLSKAKLNRSRGKGTLTDQKVDAGRQNLKQVKTPKGEGAKNREKIQAKQDVPIKSAAVSPTIASIGKADIGKLKERDIRSLFIKGFPTGTTQDAIRDLSKDIIGVRVGRSMKGNKNKRSYAYLEFKSEELAEKNRRLLLTKTIGGSKIRVDFVGDKSTQSQTQKKNVGPVEMDPLKLFVAGFGVATSAHALQKLFPKCDKVDLPNNKRRNEGRGFAFVHFIKMEDCKAAHDSSKGLKIGEKSLKVMYAKKRPEAQKRKAPDSKKQKDVAVKKRKTEKKDNKGGVNGNGDSEDDDDEDLDDDDDDEDLEDEEELSSGDDDDEDEVELNLSAAKLNKELNRGEGPKPSLTKKDRDDDEEEDSDDDDEEEDSDDDDDLDEDGDDDDDLEDEESSNGDDDDDDKVELNLSKAKQNKEFNRGKGPKPPLTKKAKKHNM